VAREAQAYQRKFHQGAKLALFAVKSFHGSGKKLSMAKK
jgi:hypothetical protein